ncbi:MAG: YigZ family protein [Candidatus Marinimicrobia bacterium]|nr:YigZ family protein [Candidatus Neomarinimicrobiota bacterium]
MKKVAHQTKFEQKIDKSRFIGYCFPVATRKEAEKYIENIEKEHYKATHVCPAYRILGENEVLSYNSDDGEPARSSGPPIESAIEGRELVNTLCVVVRYFGGIKLGIGGLIRAYGGTAGKVLDKAGVKKFKIKVTLNLSVPHKSYPDLLKALQKQQVDFDQDYDQNGAIITVELPEKEIDEFISGVKLIPGIDIDKE